MLDLCFDIAALASAREENITSAVPLGLKFKNSYIEDNKVGQGVYFLENHSSPRWKSFFPQMMFFPVLSAKLGKN